MAVFALDWALPAGLTVELLQVPVILLTLFLPGQWAPWVFGGLTTLFVALGYTTHMGADEQVGLLLNRGLVLAGLGLAVAVVLRYKRVRRAQRKSEARAEAILETAADGIMTLATDGTIESFNPAAEDIFGYRAEEIVGEHVERLVSPPHRKVVKKRLEDSSALDRAGWLGADREMTGQRKDGSSWAIRSTIGCCKACRRVGGNRWDNLHWTCSATASWRELIGKGRSTREVAERLHLSVKTVESYRSRVKDKLHVGSSNELMKHAGQWVESANSP